MFRSTLLLALLVGVPLAHAERNTIGPHLGVNLDIDDPFIGVEGRIDMTTLSHDVIVQLNPSFSFYFIDGAGGLFNLSVNVPFEFRIHDSILRPFVAPGLGLWHWSYGNRSDTDLTLNILGGLLFDLAPVEPFVQLRVALGDGSFAELMGGVLFRI